MNMDWFDQSNPSVSGCALLKIDGDTNCCSFNFYPYMQHIAGSSSALYHQLVGSGPSNFILTGRPGRRRAASYHSRALPSSLTHTHYWHIKRQLMIGSTTSLLVPAAGHIYVEGGYRRTSARLIPAGNEATSTAEGTSKIQRNGSVVTVGAASRRKQT